jgi:hypothetical protein
MRYVCLSREDGMVGVATSWSALWVPELLDSDAMRLGDQVYIAWVMAGVGPLILRVIVRVVAEIDAFVPVVACVVVCVVHSGRQKGRDLWERCGQEI